MERVRPPRASDEAVPETIGPLPSMHALPVLLDAVRSPGVTTEDVDALLQGLARPPAEDESPRAHADFLLALIESTDVSQLQGSSGVTVRTAAVRALLDLGFPYALEVPPEALAEARSGLDAPPGVKLPIPGLIAALAGLVVQCAEILPTLLGSLDRSYPLPGWKILIALLVMFGPVAMTVLGGLARKRGLLIFGLCMMALMGGFWAYALITNLLYIPSPLKDSSTYTALIAGLGFLLGPLLLRPGAWRPEEEPPPADEPPPTP